MHCKNVTRIHTLARARIHTHTHTHTHTKTTHTHTQVVIQRAVFHACPDRYFSLIVPDTPVVVCRACGHMFSEDDLEMEFLKTPQCVFCRSSDADALLWPG